jgi:thiosulfate reductase cytochrome b subunit
MSSAMQVPVAHSRLVRITHWIGAAAILGMMASGWAIYNASPILPFTIPRGLTLGGWLAAGIAWHIALMWVLMIDGLVYLAHGLLTGHLRRALLPIDAREAAADGWAALRFRLRHLPGRYNGMQRLLYLGVLAAILLTIATGFAIWKPVQLGALTWLFGGYDLARRLHFTGMAVIAAFLLVHVTLALLVPRSLASMVTGGRAVPRP